MTKVIGIDLGTTNSCVSVLEGGIPIVISSSEGGRTTPSIVGFTKSGEQLIGQLAKRQGVTNAENTIYSIKRFIGRRWEETSNERTRVAYDCVKGRDNTVDIQIRERNYTPQEISAIILKKLKKDAENFLGHSVEQAVITVPAYFTDSQRQATKDAGTIAGLEVLRIINEPTAAALAYGLGKDSNEQKIMVVDLGGGTFDVSILQLGNDVYEVKATSGNNHLGGDDFDDKIVQWLNDRFKTTEHIDLFNNKMAIQRLREAAEKAKVELSTLTTTIINLPFIASDNTGPKHLEIPLSRIEFEEMTASLIESTLDPIASALKDASMGIDLIDRIILIGGSTRIPAVQNAIKKFFKGKTLDRSVNPDEAVAMGAAIQAGVVNGDVKDVLLLDVTPLSLGIETLGEVSTKIIERNTTIPTSKGQEFSTAHDGQTSVEIHVLQGERAMAKDNKSLGKFLLTGIPPASRGVPRIEVVFDINVNGILQVSAHDLGTGREQTVSITNTGGLQDIDIKRMKEEAEKFSQDDTRRLQLVEVKNQAEALFYTYDIALRDHGHLINDSFRERAKTTANQLKILLLNTSTGLETLQKAIHQLQQEIFDMGTTVYQKRVIPHNPQSSNLFSDATKYAPLSQESAPASPPPPPHKLIMSTFTVNYEDETSDMEYEPIE